MGNQLIDPFIPATSYAQNRALVIRIKLVCMAGMAWHQLPVKGQHPDSSRDLTGLRENLFKRNDILVLVWYVACLQDPWRCVLDGNSETTYAEQGRGWFRTCCTRTLVSTIWRNRREVIRGHQQLL